MTQGSVANWCKPQSAVDLVFVCLLAMVFAGSIVCLLSHAGLVVRSEDRCPISEGYSWCETWKDFRSLSTYVLSGLVCCLLLQKPAGEGHQVEGQEHDCSRQMELIVQLS
mmetsp:Transcript_54467/g.117917  ORF Transcript_54467/g.117917 Transcript_54467/m.117917 type:complete len:110 (+) Transcript_54467:100-429(+)